MSASDLMEIGRKISLQAQREAHAERMKARQRAAASMMRRAAIPSRYAGASLADSDANSAEAYTIASSYVQSFPRRLQDGSGLVIHGDVGTGKTHLACAIVNELMSGGRSALYCTALEAVTLVRSSWRRGDESASEYDVYERFSSPDILIIDEMGVQMGTDFERLVLTSISDARSRNCRPTIIVSNLNTDALYDLLGERMFDRLVGFGAEVIHMAGMSRRMGAA